MSQELKFETLQLHAGQEIDTTVSYGAIPGLDAGVQPNLLRVSAGIEHIDDIKTDFEQAFTKVYEGSEVRI